MAALIACTTESSSRQNIKRKDMAEKVMNPLHSNHRVSHHNHYRHHYRESEIGLIPNEDLAARLIEGYLPTIVIDTRDDEVAGGQIRGALFCPERGFGSEEIKCLIQKAIEQRRLCNTGISNHKCYVVFYCRDSVKKSLSCANRFHHAVREMGGSNGICTKVLRGGAESWFRAHGKDHRLVQDFDDSVWNQNCKQKVAHPLPKKNPIEKA